MPKRRSRFLLVALTLLLALAAFGSLRGIHVTSSTRSREIVGISKCLLSPANLASDPERVTLKLGTHAATVTSAVVSLDDGRTVAIPAECKRVEVRETGKGLVVSLDGVVAP